MVFLMILTGCSQGEEEKQSDCTTPICEQQLKYDQVIAVHDEVMSKLSRISELKATIETRMKEEDDSVVKQNWYALKLSLDKADKTMWVWMRQFKPQMDSTTIEANMIYLDEQLQKVDNVALNINAAIDSANQALKK
jgi:hypothetical protein